MAKVELKGISKVYEGGVKAVDNANIVVEDKEFVVLVGPQAAGSLPPCVWLRALRKSRRASFT